MHTLHMHSLEHKRGAGATKECSCYDLLVMPPKGAVHGRDTRVTIHGGFSRPQVDEWVEGVADKGNPSARRISI